VLVTLLITMMGASPLNAADRRGVSSQVGRLSRQADGKFGFAMLRPAGWTAHDGAEQGRVYRDAKSAAQAHVILSVSNLAVATHPDPSEGADLDWELFRRDRSLDGWTAGLERLWQSNRQPFTLVQRLPNAKVYATSYPNGSQFGLVAYVVDAGQPLVVGLTGPEAYGRPLKPLAQLRADGLYADFITMVKSVRAAPADPARVSPPLD
jgi:hypothetical protein